MYSFIAVGKVPIFDLKEIPQKSLVSLSNPCLKVFPNRVPGTIIILTPDCSANIIENRKQKQPAYSNANDDIIIGKDIITQVRKPTITIKPQLKPISITNGTPKPPPPEQKDESPIILPYRPSWREVRDNNPPVSHLICVGNLLGEILITYRRPFV